MKETTTKESKNSKTEQYEAYPQAELNNPDISSDIFKIIGVKIERNFMEFEVQYAGGCQKHDFKLIGNTTLSNSNPQERTIKLIHSKNKETCKAIITEKIKFAISNLSIDYNKDKKVILKLLNNDQNYIYSYE